MVIPVLEALISGHRMTHSTWIAAACSVFGMYFVSGLGDSHISNTNESWSETNGVSELIIFISMFFWSFSIMAGDRGCKKCDVMTLTAIDFVVVTVMSLITSFILEPDEWIYPYTHIRANLTNVIAVGITEAAGFVYCALGQIVVNSSRTALILSMEALSGAFFGYLFLKESLSVLEVCGCIIVSFSFIISAEEWDMIDVQRILNNWWYSGTPLYGLGNAKNSGTFDYELIRNDDSIINNSNHNIINNNSFNNNENESQSISNNNNINNNFIQSTITHSLKGVNIPTLLGYTETSTENKII